MLTGNQKIYTVVGIAPVVQDYTEGYEVRMFAFFNKTDADRKVMELHATGHMGFSKFYVAVETVGNVITRSTGFFS